MDEFFAAYIECAIWSSTGYGDEDGSNQLPLDDLGYTAEDITPESLDRMRADCEDFCSTQDPETGENVDLDGNEVFDVMAAIAGREVRAGQDFWLTRNRHGAGYWDGDWPADVADYLTDRAHAFGGSDLIENGDGTLSVS